MPTWWRPTSATAARPAPRRARPPRRRARPPLPTVPSATPRPSLIFRADSRELIAGGFQSLVAYDVLLANLDPALERRSAPRDVAEVLAAFPDGLYTAEVAEVYASGAASETDLAAAEERLIAAADAGTARRVDWRWTSV